MAYPTDAAYALGCAIDNREGLARMLRLRRLPDDHQCTLVCRDLSDLGTLAQVNNPNYRLLKKTIPGPFTFILEASREVPKRLVQPKRKTIGLRVPDCRITQLILEELGGPLLSTTLIMPDQSIPEFDPYEIRQLLEHEVDLVVDGGVKEWVQKKNRSEPDWIVKHGFDVRGIDRSLGVTGRRGSRASR